MKDRSPLVLASKSSGRKSMLEKAGLVFECIPADIDERDVINRMTQFGEKKEEIAVRLASEKALKISTAEAGKNIIGSDQLLILGDEILEKAKNTDGARNKLKKLRGKTHTLISAVCVVADGDILWSACETAHLTMRSFDDIFLERYIAAAGDAVTACVGAYALEEKGSWLFEKVHGDIFTIIGMPLFPLLEFLKDRGYGP